MITFTEWPGPRIPCTHLLDVQICLVTTQYIWLNLNLILLPSFLEGVEKQLRVWWIVCQLPVDPFGQIYTPRPRNSHGRQYPLCSHDIYSSGPSILSRPGELCLGWTLQDKSEVTRIHCQSLKCLVHLASPQNIYSDLSPKC